MVGRVIENVGAAAISACHVAGGITVLFARVVKALAPPTLDGRELVRNLHRMGTESVPIMALTAFFTGGIMVIQSGVFVRRYGATGLLGWGTGYATLREIGPLLLGLMFSGRVGANNTAELGTMRVTEQLDGLRALAIDPIRHLLAPRVVAMVLALMCLTLLGDLVAILGAALAGKVILGVEGATFYQSFVDNLSLADLGHGLAKAGAFGLSIALTSCYFGVNARGGAVGVGRAVNASVVTSALAIVLVDFLVTFVMR